MTAPDYMFNLSAVLAFILTIFYILLALGVLFGLFRLVVFYLRKRNRLPRSLSMVSLLVLVPREVKPVTEEAKKEEKEIISVAEQMYSNLYAIEKAMSKFNRWLFGKDHLAFEIVACESEIRFYVSCPRKLKDYVEKQIHSQYPKAEISQAGEYNIFQPKGKIEAAALVLEKPCYLPFKTYRKLETDPLHALTTALSKLDENEGAAIQILIRPASNKWRKKGPKIAEQMMKGKGLGKGAEGDFLVKGAKTFGRVLVPKEIKERVEAKKEREEGALRLTPIQEEQVKSIEEKAGKLGFETNIRIITSSESEVKAKMHLSNIIGAFTQLSDPYLNRLKPKKRLKRQKLIEGFVFRYFSEKISSILNVEELTSIFHFPTKFTETPNIKWLLAKVAPAPANTPKEGLLLGKNIYRGIETKIYIKDDDRRRHMYVIGQTGTGKSVFLQNLVIQDIQSGRGVCVVDPHGDLVDGILPHIPKERADDVILFEPFDTDRPMGLNMLEFKTEDQKDFAVQEMIAIFYKLFPPEMIGPMFEHNMRNVMLTLMADKDSPGTIAEIPRMFTDPDYQKVWIRKLKDPVVRAFWEKEMARTTEFHKSEMLGYLISKVGRFVENEMMRNIIGQPHSAFDLRQVMDNQKILLVNLSKGKVGEVNSSLLGLIIVSKIQMAAYSRADMPEEERKDFYLYVDEFQNFATDSFASILAEARKYRLNLICAHQYISQLDEKIRDAVLGNVGTFIAFRVGVEDAELVAKEFDPVFSETDVINIERYHAYLRLMIDAAVSKPFTMATYPPIKGGSKEIAEAIRNLSRLKYGKAKKVVEHEILERARLGAQESTQAIDTEKTL